MKESEVLTELWEIREKMYEAIKDLSEEEQNQKMRKDAEEAIKYFEDFRKEVNRKKYLTHSNLA